MTDQQRKDFTAEPIHRVVSAIFGLLLIASGAYVLLALMLDTGRIIGAAVLLVIGGNLILASWRGRASWISKIGPLP